jgi:hypothetical protein
MSALAAAVALGQLGIAEPFYPCSYRQATWPSAARKVYACLRWYVWKYGVQDGRLDIPDRVGSQWCSKHYEGERYGSTGRRCWQKGLKQLELRGVIRRDRQHGGRVITILIVHPGPTPKAAPRPKAAGKGQAATSRTPNVGPIQDATPEQQAAAAATLATLKFEAPPDDPPIPAGFDWRKIVPAVAVPQSETAAERRAERDQAALAAALARLEAARGCGEPDRSQSPTDPAGPEVPAQGEGS